jgi:hypothetical protein
MPTVVCGHVQRINAAADKRGPSASSLELMSGVQVSEESWIPFRVSWSTNSSSAESRRARVNASPRPPLVRQGCRAAGAVFAMQAGAPEIWPPRREHPTRVGQRSVPGWPGVSTRAQHSSAAAFYRWAGSRPSTEGDSPARTARWSVSSSPGSPVAGIHTRTGAGAPLGSGWRSNVSTKPRRVLPSVNASAMLAISTPVAMLRVSLVVMVPLLS